MSFHEGERRKPNIKARFALAAVFFVSPGIAESNGSQQATSQNTPRIEAVLPDNDVLRNRFEGVKLEPINPPNRKMRYFDQVPHYNGSRKR